jgi:hypothetical protein
MTDHDNDAVPVTPACCKPFPDKEGPDATAPEFREYRYRGKGKGRHAPFGRSNCDRRGQDVAHDPPLINRNQRQSRNKIAVLSQGIDQHCLSGLTKRTDVKLKNGRYIGRGFFADCDIIHVSILSF